MVNVSVALTSNPTWLHDRDNKLVHIVFIFCTQLYFMIHSLEFHYKFCPVYINCFTVTLFLTSGHISDHFQIKSSYRCHFHTASIVSKPYISETI